MDLWRAGISATKAGDFFPLIKLVADWEATTEILADPKLVESVKEEKAAYSAEKGR